MTTHINEQDTNLIIGNLLARMDRVEEDVKQISEKQDEILKILHTAQGGWKTLVTVGGIGVAIGGTLATIVSGWGTIARWIK
jgi:hypothetical protein